MLDMYGIMYGLRLITSASHLTTFKPCYTIQTPALLARDESQQPSRRNGAGFVLSGGADMGTRIDVTGERYGRLVAIEYVETVRVGTQGQVKAIWKFMCDCGAVVNRKLNQVRKGDTTSCGCRQREIMRNGIYRITLAPGEASFNGLYAHYKKSARERSMGWDLDVVSFRALTKQNCYYCGIVPSQSHLTQASVNGSYLYTGVDRVDNTRGYEPGNVVPCCSVCNRAKHTMSQEEFLAWVQRISSYQAARKVSMETSV